jgi:hypothetical protein
MWCVEIILKLWPNLRYIQYISNMHLREKYLKYEVYITLILAPLYDKPCLEIVYISI